MTDVMPVRPVWSLKRFLPRAILLMVVAGVVWRFTFTLNADIAVRLTKYLHSLVGRPSPYMFCDETRLFWHATMFVPEFGLILASYWIGWPGRIVRVLAVYTGHSLLTACTITIHESPYLQQNEFVNVATSTLVNANYLLFGVASWVLVAGPWHRSDHSPKQGVRRFSQFANNWPVRLMLLCLAMSTTVPLFAVTGTADAMKAREELASAMSAVPWFPRPGDSDEGHVVPGQLERDRLAVKALSAMRRVIEIDMQADEHGESTIGAASVWFLTAHMLASLRPDDPDLRQAFKNQAALALNEARKRRRR